jgi:hypothetical protein
MPKPLIDFLLHPWTIAVGSILLGAIILWAWSGLRTGIAVLAKRVWVWARQWRITREPRPMRAIGLSVTALPEFIEAPRWLIRSSESERNVYGLKNAGGTALHVRIRAERDEVELSGKLDHERVEAGTYVPFRADRLAMDGLADTWLLVGCRDAAGEVQQVARVKIAGILT